MSVRGIPHAPPQGGNRAPGPSLCRRHLTANPPSDLHLTAKSTSDLHPGEPFGHPLRGSGLLACLHHRDGEQGVQPDCGQFAGPDDSIAHPEGGLLTNYFAIRHPSLPNYLAMVAGSTFNLSRDCDLCHVDAPNLADQIEAAGRQWKAYNEDIPAPCFGVSVGEFDKSHDPFLYFDSIRQNPERCAPRVVALDSLPTDLASANPPDLMWIVPNLCHTMHDCDIAAGDAWLAQWIPLVTRSPAFQNGGVLFLTFDEGLTDRGCCGAAGGGQIATIVLSPWVTAGTHDGTLYTHYSLLRTIEEAWGFSPLGAAAGATPITGIWRSPASESR